MANRIVQAIYDLKDNVTAKLKKIGDSWRKSEGDSDKAAKGVDRSANRMAASFAVVTKAAKAFGAAIIATAAAVGLGKLADGIAAVLNTGEKFDDIGKKFASAFGGLAQGEAAMAAVRDIAADTPQSFEEVAEAAIRLRKQGFDPLDGTLQALIDNNAALDGSQQDLIQTIDTLGKANLRGQLNMRAFVALQQQGIPVAELLAKAMGKSEAEVRRLAASGQLGADAIALLVQEVGKLRAGAAADEAGDLDAQFTKLRDTLQGIANDLAQGGPLDVAREQMVDLNEEVRRLAATPEFAALKQSLIETFGAGVEAGRAFIDGIDLTDKIAQITVYSNAIRDVFRIADVSSEPVFQALDLLTGPFERMKEAAGIGLTFVADKLEQLKGGATEAKEEIEKIPVVVTEVADQVFLATAAIDAFNKTVSTVGNARENGVSVAAQAIVNDLAQVVESEAETRTAIKGLFESVSQLPDTRLGDIALAIAQIGTDSGIAGTNVREGLAAEIKKMSGEDLLRFQQASQAAFEQFGVSAEEAATVLNATLLSALERLGVSGDSLGVDFTAAGQEIIATFEAVATSAVATGAQIESGFKAALAKVATSAEAEALGAALENAGKRGVIGLDAAERSAAALRARLREIQEAADPLQDAFERLGITSQRALQDAADTAREAFDQIVSGAQRGGAATEDVRQAFLAYAEAQLAAAKNSTEFERTQVEAMLRVRAQALGVTGALQELGLAGSDAGAKVAGGAEEATVALNDTAAAAGSVAEKIGQTDAAAQSAGSAAGGYINVLQAFITEFMGVSDAALAQFVKFQRGTVGVGIPLEKSALKLLEVAKATREAIGSQKDQASGLGEIFDQLANAGDNAAEVLISVGLRGSEAMDDFGRAVREGQSDLRLLNQADLDQLADSAEKAADKIREIEQAARDAKSELADMQREFQDEADKREGNLAEIEKRRFEDQLRRINELAAAGGAAAAATAAETARLAEIQHRANLARIEEESRARKKASNDESGNKPSAPSRPSNSGGGGGGGPGGGGTGATFNFEGANFYGTPDEKTAEAWERMFMKIRKKIQGRSE